MGDAIESEDRAVWRRIDDLIDGVAELARGTTSEREFYRRLLEAAVQAGAALGGAVWLPASCGQLELQTHCRLDETPWTDPAVRRDHERWLAEIYRDGRFPARSPHASDGRQSASLTHGHSVACPVRVDDRVIRIVDVWQRPELSPESQRGYAAVLETFCELAADFHRRGQLRDLQCRQAAWTQAERFIERVHSQPDPEAVAFCIANDGRTLVACDRVTVAVRRRGAYRVLAISGLDTPAARANAVEQLQRLVERVAVLGQPLWHAGPNAEIPAEIESAVRDYVDGSHARTLGVVPLDERPDGGRQTARPAPFAALVFEAFTALPMDRTFQDRVDLVVRHAGAALRNAERFGRLPFGRWLASRRSPAAERRWPRYLACLLLLTATAAILALVPAEFVVTCHGTAQPAIRRQMFAPFSGQMEQLQVRHGDRVAAGQVLATISSAELSFQYTRLLGEIQTAAEELNSVRSARLASTPATAEQRDRAARLAADEQRLKKELQTLDQQRQLIEAERAKQQLTSPIAGQVLTWQLAELLEARPVERGQLLMTVGQTHGDWILELRVPDRDVLAVREAQQDLGPDVEVHFLLASDPGTQHRGRLKQLSMLVEADSEQQLSAVATVGIDRSARADLRPGTGVTARIHCGRRPVGYVWLRDLIHALRRWLFI